MLSMQSIPAGPYQWVLELQGLQMFNKNSGQELLVYASLGIVLLFLNWGSLSRGTTSWALRAKIEPLFQTKIEPRQRLKFTPV
jgi:hypothetical protein